MKRPEDCKKAALYLRISQDRSGRGDAIERQREDCESWCRYHEWDVVEEYVDHAISAYSGTERPAYERMLEDFRAGRFDVVVAWKLDRLTRSVGKISEAVKTIPDLCILSGDYGFLDLTTADGRYLTTLFVSNAEFESARKGERERRANLQRAMRGEARCAARPPFGYDREMNVVPAEAAVVRELYRLRAKGYPENDLLRAVNGERTTHDYPVLAAALDQLGDRKPWSRTKLHYLFANPRYAGYVAYVSEPENTGAKRRNRASIVAENIVRDEDGKPVKGKWEAIVDEATWRTVREGLRARARGKQDAYRKFFGSGVYRCGVCGRPLYAASGSYRCLETGHVCRLQQPIDTLVVATVRAYLGLPNYRDLLPKRADEDVLEELRAKIAQAEAELKRIREDYRAHLIDGAFYKQVYDEQMEVIEGARREQDRLASDPTGILECDDPVAAFDAVCGDPTRMHDIIDYLLEVTVSPRPRENARGHRGFSYEGIDIKWKQH